MNTIEQHFQEILQGKKPANLYNPISYILMQPGKRLRPQMVRIASDMFNGNPEQTGYIAAAFEMLHNFTLIHDDIMDKADVRRGQPTVYKKWNGNIAILAGDALAVMAMQQLLKLQCDPKIILDLIDIFGKTALEVCEGQQYDLDFETIDNVPLEEYLNMIRLKTSVMFAGCLKAGGRFAGADEESLQALYDLGIHLGIAFQLADDLLDVYADEEVFGKAVGGDIKDNKKTYVYLKALELADESQKQELLRLFSTTPANEKEKFLAVKNIFDAVNVKEATEEAIALYTAKCIDDINRIHTEEQKKAFVLSLVNSLQSRNK
ncbi:MAG: polyprenyl synthetase family protein [Bacteroidales bacterium]|nr:polyprenyl synthetase family protein [Bacteroidales bacterium]